MNKVVKQYASKRAYWLAADTFSLERELCVCAVHPWRLLSYYAISMPKSMSSFYEDIKLPDEKRPHLFIDSGAFSAWRKGVTISLPEYASFLHSHLKFIDVYASLDVIGDEVASMKNLKDLEAEGLRPLPCWHIGEPLDVLRHMVDNYPYFSIGGMVGRRSRIVTHLDEAFSIICDRDGFPKNRIHGFGMGVPGLILRYPWFSVDSSSWLASSRNGQIWVPAATPDGWDYTNITVVSVSYGDIGDNPNNLQNLPEARRGLVMDFLKELGVEYGETTWRTVQGKYKPQPGEFIAERHSGGSKVVGFRKVPGVTNFYGLRDVVTAHCAREMWKVMLASPMRWNPPVTFPTLV